MSVVQFSRATIHDVFNAFAQIELAVSGCIGGFRGFLLVVRENCTTLVVVFLLSSALTFRH
jgi:hypothetical protein